MDCDSYESYCGWLENMPRTPLRIKSPRGMHFIYRAPNVEIKSDSHIQHPKGFSYDVKGRRSYCMLPPSIRKGIQYSFCCCTGNLAGGWVPYSSLPTFNPAWRPGRSTDVQHESDKKVRDAVSYISKIQAVQGNGGDKDTYRACCRLAESGLTPLEQYQALLDWNAAGNAVPQWSATDLRRKLELAQKEMS